MDRLVGEVVSFVIKNRTSSLYLDDEEKRKAFQQHPKVARVLANLHIPSAKEVFQQYWLYVQPKASNDKRKGGLEAYNYKFRQQLGRVSTNVVSR